jgi:hypothetical protein
MSRFLKRNAVQPAELPVAETIVALAPEVGNTIPAPAAPVSTIASRRVVASDLYRRVTEALRLLDRGDVDGNQLSASEHALLKRVVAYVDRTPGASLSGLLKDAGIDADKIQPFATRSTYNV